MRNHCLFGSYIAPLTTAGQGIQSVGVKVSGLQQVLISPKGQSSGHGAANVPVFIDGLLSGNNQALILFAGLGGNVTLNDKPFRGLVNKSI